MNFGIVAETLLERLALRLGFVPVPLVDALFGPLKARVVMSGVSLGVFEALAHGSLTAEEIAAARRLDAEGTRLLCRALAHFGYLRLQDIRFAITPMAARSLVEGAPADLRGYLAWNAVQWRYLEGVDDLVRGGRGIDFHASLDEDGWRRYQQAMFDASRFDAKRLVPRIPVPRGATRLLDLGGGHGALAAAVCRAHPRLRATVIDLEPAVAQGRRLAASGGYAELVTFVAGDLRSTALPAADVVLLSNVLHHFAADESAAVLRRVHETLSPGGTVAIWELDAPPRRGPASHGDVAALFFRLTSTAETPSAEGYAAWLSSGGFDDVRIARSSMLPGRVLVVARRRF
jgi:SAM-dependent methyltransferase